MKKESKDGLAKQIINYYKMKIFSCGLLFDQPSSICQKKNILVPILHCFPKHPAFTPGLGTMLLRIILFPHISPTTWGSIYLKVPTGMPGVPPWGSRWQVHYVTLNLILFCRTLTYHYCSPYDAVLCWFCCSILGFFHLFHWRSHSWRYFSLELCWGWIVQSFLSFIFF